MEEVHDIVHLQKQAKIMPIIIYGGMGLLPTIQSSFGLSFVTTAIPYYSDANKTINAEALTENQLSWFASTTSACVLLGTAISSFSIDNWGRRRSLLIGILLQVASWGILQITQEFPALLFNRVTAGISAGITSPSTVAFLSDISTVALRGSCGVFTFMVNNVTWMLCLGLATVIDFQTSIKIVSLPMLLFLALYCAMPESPVWLVKSGKINEAEDVLRRIRGEDYSVGPEIKELRELQNVEEKVQNSNSNNKDNNKGFGKLAIFEPSFIKPLRIMTILTICQANVGMDLLCYYSIDIFGNVNLPMDPYLFAMFMQTDITIGFVISTFLASRIPRRIHFMAAITLKAFSMAIIAWTLMGEPKEGDDVTPMIMSIAIMVASFSYGLGVGPVIFTLLGEVFPPALKGAGCGIVFGTRNICVFLVLKLYPTIKALIGFSGIFMMHTMVALTGLLFAFFFMPETFGLSSREISQLFVSKRDKLISHKQEANQLMGKTIAT